jgi:hypothetical protein
MIFMLKIKEAQLVQLIIRDQLVIAVAMKLSSIIFVDLTKTLIYQNLREFQLFLVLILILKVLLKKIK